MGDPDDDRRAAARQERPEEPRTADEVDEAAGRAELVGSHQRPASDDAGIHTDGGDREDSTTTR